MVYYEGIALCKPLVVICLEGGVAPVPPSCSFGDASKTHRAEFGIPPLTQISRMEVLRSVTKNTGPKNGFVGEKVCILCDVVGNVVIYGVGITGWNGGVPYCHSRLSHSSLTLFGSMITRGNEVTE